MEKTKEMPETVWLVWADRGDYSDRTEYAVCWFATKDEADAHAAALQERAALWRRRFADDCELPYGELWEKATAEVGDPGWSPSDYTEYRAVELKRGKPIASEVQP